MSEPGGPGQRPGEQWPPYSNPQQHRYPQWQPPVPPKKASPAAVVLVGGSVVVVILMALAFLAWGYPGFLRDPDVKTMPGISPGGQATLVSPAPTATTPSTPAALPGGRVPMPKRTKALADPVTCAFTPDPGSPAQKKVALPPDGPAPSSGTAEVRLATSAGDIGLTLDRALAPCTVVNFLSLVKQGFYDGTSCHRLSVTAGLQMLQCGDPVGDGTGGPGYTIRDEVFPELTYGRGILAMAKTNQPDSGGSQFFLVYGDSNIPPEYTVFGSIDDAGLAVVDKVARGGVDQSKPGLGDGSGPPKIPVKFTHVTTS